LIVAATGTAFLIRRRTRRRGLMAFVAGVALIVIAYALPAPESRVARAASHLDAIVPVWQFNEFHSRNVAAPPERVFHAVRKVRADEIRLFHTLVWIRRGGREGPESILNPGGDKPLLDVATQSGFVWLADDPPRELAVGTVVVAPPGTRGPLTPEVFHRKLPPGFAVAVMSFIVTPDEKGGSIVSTETRVFANDDASRRRFAKYWRVIYPGSALIRRMWLRAIARRAENPRSP
jgi:hypothetical protein